MDQQRASPASDSDLSQSDAANRSARACDSCRRRKTKCIRKDGETCVKCAAAALTCTFNHPVLKKGPKLGRRKRDATSSCPLGESSVDSNGIPTERDMQASPALPEGLTHDMMEFCLDIFLAHVQPHMPIMDAEEAHQLVRQVDTSIEAYCVIVALCAHALLVAVDIGGVIDDTAAAEELATTLEREIVEGRKCCDFIEQPPTTAIVTSIFLSSMKARQGKYRSSWFYMREATSLAHIAGLDNESHYETCSQSQAAKDRRVYWYIFVSERLDLLRNHRPTTLQVTIHPPTSSNVALDGAQLCGFFQLVNLSKWMDSDFGSIWNDPVSTDITFNWIARIQQQIQMALPMPESACETQQVDLLCTQAWMYVVVWQFGLRKEMGSRTSNPGAMSPLEIAQTLVNTLNRFPIETLRAHGHVLTEKLFTIACYLVESMSHESSIQDNGNMSSEKIINSLLLLISKLPGSQRGFVPLLLEKIRIARYGLDEFNVPTATKVSAPQIPVPPSPVHSLSEDSLTGLVWQEPQPDVWLSTTPAASISEWSTSGVDYFDSANFSSNMHYESSGLDEYANETYNPSGYNTSWNLNP